MDDKRDKLLKWKKQEKHTCDMQGLCRIIKSKGI
jgi:hypothetical protein